MQFRFQHTPSPYALGVLSLGIYTILESREPKFDLSSLPNYPTTPSYCRRLSTSRRCLFSLGHGHASFLMLFSASDLFPVEGAPCVCSSRGSVPRLESALPAELTRCVGQRRRGVPLWRFLQVPERVYFAYMYVAWRSRVG